MKVALDLRALDDPALAERGIGRYAGELAAALAAEGVEVVDLRATPRRRSGADVLHTPSIDGVTFRPGLPYVVTLHDLVPLKYPERYLRTGVRHRLRYAAVKRATRVIAPSHAVAADAQRLLGITHVDVVPEAPAAPFRPVTAPRGLLARLRLPDRFLLWVGGLDPPDPRKGLDPLVRRAAEGACPPLVLAGRHDASAAQLPREGRVVLTGRVNDEELAALYSAADALVLPSEDEGFGLTAARGARVWNAGRGVRGSGAHRDARGEPRRPARRARRPRRAPSARRRNWPGTTEPRPAAEPGRTSRAKPLPCTARSAVGLAPPEGGAHARHAHQPPQHVLPSAQRQQCVRPRERFARLAIAALPDPPASQKHEVARLSPPAAVLVHEAGVGRVHDEHRLGHLGHVRGDAAPVAAVADPRARLAKE